MFTPPPVPPSPPVGSGVVTSGNSLDYTAEDMARMVQHEAAVKVRRGMADGGLAGDGAARVLARSSLVLPPLWAARSSGGRSTAALPPRVPRRHAPACLPV
jgi:hypothetical protein